MPSFFPRLVIAKVPGWLLYGQPDYQRCIAHGLLQTARAGHTAHLSYEPRECTCQLQIRLDGVRERADTALLLQLMAGARGVRLWLEPEIRAAFVQAFTLAWDDSPADRVLAGLTSGLRQLLDDDQVFVALGIR